MIKRTHLSENFKRTSTRKQNHGAPDLKGFSPLGGTNSRAIHLTLNDWSLEEQ